MTKRFIEVKPGYGYCATISDAHETIREYQTQSSARFAVFKSDKGFGKIDVAAKQRNVVWESTNPKFNGEHMQFDGIPFIILGRKILMCKLGENSRSRKRKSTEDESPRKSTGSSSMGCPALIFILEVFKFSDYELIDGEDEALKLSLSQQLCVDLNNGRALGERRFYIIFPSLSEHRTHPVFYDNKWMEPDTLPADVMFDMIIPIAPLSTDVNIPTSEDDLHLSCGELLDEIMQKTYTADEETLSDVLIKLKYLLNELSHKETYELVEVTYPLDLNSDIIYTLNSEPDSVASQVTL